MPRINVQIKKIFIPDSERMILVLRIPEGQNKPYFNNRANKYYKRYNFEAKEMSESEIEALYRERFFGVSRLSQYINDVISFNRSRLPVENHSIIDGHIIVTPLRIEDKIMDVKCGGRIANELRNVVLDVPDRCPNYLYGIAKPSRYGIRWNDDHEYKNVEVHRNGLVYCMQDYEDHGHEGEKLYWDYGFACRLLQTILFSDAVYSKLNFIGKVKIVIKIFNCMNSQPVSSYTQRPRPRNIETNSEEIYVEREWDSWKLKEDRLRIGKSMMDEISNYFGIWTSPTFEEQDNNVRFVWGN
ncbi:MAG: ATP-binding protein [Methanosarcina sp.]|nr:ATP-binding protein [Methanosarcina sp.]MDD3874387.1 ATP-binding protein [Methanosarcina sp.]MDD4522348.1 ATP-binding protein [Methanosarcina sp.]